MSQARTSRFEISRRQSEWRAGLKDNRLPSECSHLELPERFEVLKKAQQEKRKMLSIEIRCNFNQRMVQRALLPRRRDLQCTEPARVQSSANVEIENGKLMVNDGNKNG